ncbi:hypothetical protein [Desulfosporosinus hippei]|uniref:Uncharacterized protein n=1 Tax=Desulfosporosinus hippei DSM 8344 TaxID=1121419 RepID=A0A1G7UI73_9FIRM|nr:hypothetical protein [Desulfosporosinus hippei]SDG47187.1 hypothetical protein SAMN05443529_103151 [Desulfosporosinus hippei DSM 8344]
MKNWKVPGVILVLLMLAIAFRWNIDKNTNGSTVVKYSTDRWNGAVYYERLSSSDHSKRMIQSQSIAMDWYSSKSLTVIWGVLTCGSVIWLLFTIRDKRMFENEAENRGIE